MARSWSGEVGGGIRRCAGSVWVTWGSLYDRGIQISTFLGNFAFSFSFQGSYVCTGCPTALGPLCFLLFCQFLLYQNTKIWWVLKNSGNLLSYWHQNFKNRWRNSWDNWHQRWHLSFRSWHFTIPQGQKNNFGVVGGNFDVNYLSYF